MGGMHAIYIFSYQQKSINNFSSGYDFPAYIPSEAGNLSTHHLYQKMLDVEANNTTAKRELYGSLSWIAYPLLKSDETLLSNEARIALRINKEYKNFIASGENEGRPMYSWDMTSVRTVTNDRAALVDVLKMINVVPNPYNAFSEYESSKLDNRVKIINLPEQCLIRIFNTQGKLIKTIRKDNPMTFQDWTLTNYANVPVSSGVYLIHIEVPGV
jgi:hypothetical protein